MKKSSVLKEKSFKFSLAVVEICRFLKKSKTEYVLYNQLLRSGTAVGALISEAEFAQSKADFINKLSIALKEENETVYWFGILVKSNSLNENTLSDANYLLTEVIKMLISSINTSKGNHS